jgi:hypothetical protein
MATFPENMEGAPDQSNHSVNAPHDVPLQAWSRLARDLALGWRQGL